MLRPRDQTKLRPSPHTQVSLMDGHQHVGGRSLPRPSLSLVGISVTDPLSLSSAPPPCDQIKGLILVEGKLLVDGRSFTMAFQGLARAMHVMGG